MKGLLNIIILLLICAACKSQTTKCLYDTEEVDSILELKDKTINDLANENTKLHSQADSFLLIIDSLGLIVNSCEASQASSSFIWILDTAYVYIADSNNNYVKVRKNGSKINVKTVKDSLRISTFYDDYRSVYLMNGNKTKLSAIEDTLTTIVDFEGFTINIEKK